MAAWRMDGKAGRAEFREIRQTSAREMRVLELGEQQWGWKSADGFEGSLGGEIISIG